MAKNMLYTPVLNYCEHIGQEFDLISDPRKFDLLSLSKFMKAKLDDDEIPKVIVICTHNSRRSHLGQLWLAVASQYYNIPAIQTFSGGTESTAFNPRVVTTLKNVGFEIQSGGTNKQNPIYFIRFSNDIPAYQAFSKKYDSTPNPTENFAAIMVCSEADADCPVVTGADFRLFLPFDDPKAFDDTEQESEKYTERCRQIAREMMFVVSKIHSCE